MWPSKCPKNLGIFRDEREKHGGKSGALDGAGGSGEKAAGWALGDWWAGTNPVGLGGWVLRKALKKQCRKRNRS